MANFFNDYITFISRPFEETNVTGIQVFPQFFTQMALFTIGFSCLYKLVPSVLESVWPKWYNDLEPIKRKEMPTYLISFVHHFIVVPLGWLHIYQDFTMWRSNIQPVENYYAIDETPLIALGCAFLLADILNSAFDDAFTGKPLYLLHHVLIITFGKSNGSYHLLIDCKVVTRM